ncbi:MAG TPA: hypothetical protein VGS07_18855 [Thermoanaerobaculia bacterium]|jgi:hypothetical protein|nr:hypothetical protein [Thermoanaerobaculia bacterium]
MSWTLLLAGEDGDAVEESYAGLDDELAEYLASLDGFPALQALWNLPREGKTRLPEEVQDALAQEVEALAAQAKRRELPEPPEWVGLEGTGDIRLGEPLGWSGLLAFLQRVEHLIFLSRRMRLGLWAVGED